MQINRVSQTETSGPDPLGSLHTLRLDLNQLNQITDKTDFEDRLAWVNSQ